MTPGFNKEKTAAAMFEAEALALKKMDTISPGFAPKLIHYTASKDQPSYLVTEYIPMRFNVSNPDIQRKMGAQLAQLHFKGQSDKFGFDVTSFCGSTRLENGPSSDWCQFWLQQRMKPLLDQVKGQNTDLDVSASILCARMDHWLGKDALDDIQPCLLHGDLWSGNWAVNADTNLPVLFDPAPYYGHHEVEFEGRPERLMLYELYHQLNHYAMFGAGYDDSCLNIIERLL
ncbi:Fructosamine/Ketosamine-3-kinase [Sporodiniella umbellata]|nr:Fructosamine/Ketosamine-3-kinase [Sporodiniella umbellata]